MKAPFFSDSISGSSSLQDPPWRCPVLTIPWCCLGPSRRAVGVTYHQRDVSSLGESMGRKSDLWSFWILIGTIQNEFEKWMMVVSGSVKLC